MSSAPSNPPLSRRSQRQVNRQSIARGTNDVGDDNALDAVPIHGEKKRKKDSNVNTGKIPICLLIEPRNTVFFFYVVLVFTVSSRRARYSSLPWRGWCISRAKNMSPKAVGATWQVRHTQETSPFTSERKNFVKEGLASRKATEIGSSPWRIRSNDWEWSELRHLPRVCSGWSASSSWGWYTRFRKRGTHQILQNS